MFAARGAQVLVVDINDDAVTLVNSGRSPFDEPGMSDLLQKVRNDGLLRATTDAAEISEVEYVVIVVGTPVNEYLSPDPGLVTNTVESLVPHLRDGQHLVLRSTVYPGVTRMVETVIAKSQRQVTVSFCPERIAQGKAMTELTELPQIIASRTAEGSAAAQKLFSLLAARLVEVSPEEAELAKLFTNTWRYIKFAAANQLFMIANDWGVDFERVRYAITTEYPRAADMPGAGFAAGPCLFKDAMQVAAFSNSTFSLGHAAMAVNEGLPSYVVERMARRFDLANLRVGILGTAFKAESDDTRSSLAYKLRKLLAVRCAVVMCADDNVSTDPGLVREEELLAGVDLVVFGTPHPRYKTMQIRQPVVDIWNVRGNGVLL
jgi:UDP-N-acetyl-D-mannosaminuronic acid dehydrogenase